MRGLVADGNFKKAKYRNVRKFSRGKIRSLTFCFEWIYFMSATLELTNIILKNHPGTGQIDEAINPSFSPRLENF